MCVCVGECVGVCVGVCVCVCVMIVNVPFPALQDEQQPLVSMWEVQFLLLIH